ncbi:MAG: hypothetical protein KKB34_10280 [Bacteroidetes bacterium]|nr:hypothetical protein [Bacteroidota bacterium]
MTTTLTHFGLTENQIIRKDNNFYLPITNLSEVLQIDKKRLLENIRRNREEFGEIGVLNLRTPSGKQDSFILDEEQIYLSCMMIRGSEKAKEFRRAFAKTLKKIRTREFVHISEVNKIIETNKLLTSIPAAMLTKYKKIREFGLSRKQACRALVLPYSKMREVDKLLGFYKPNPAAKALIPYYFKSKNGGNL